MTIDARTVADGQELEYDICIVGGGAAGITIAREFIGKPYKVCLLESGGLGDPDEKTESLRDGKNIGIDYYDIKDLTYRGMGGNTGRWASFIRPFVPIDFEKRDWVPYSGWPFGLETLEPYQEKATQICGVGENVYDTDTLIKNARDSALKPLPFNPDRLETHMWRFRIPPQNWRDAYKDELEAAKNVDVYLFGNVVDIQTNDAIKQVEKVQVKCVSGTGFKVKARAFILAMGGVETPRVMLASNWERQKTGIGNQNDLVGRFYMEHPHFYRSAMALFAKHEDFPALYTWEARTEHSILGGITPSAKLQRERKILNYVTTFANSTYAFGEASMGQNLLGSIRGFMNDLGSMASRSFRNNYFRDWFGMRTYRRLFVEFHPMIEQAPNPDSRVTLSDEKDMLGLPRIQLNWQMTELDRHTLFTVNQVIAEEMGAAGLGRVRIDYSEADQEWPKWQYTDGPSLGGGWHYMGTTRIHEDPKQGVVDPDCKVHGLNNLYISGCSLFPTVSFANPTLTIVILALRMVDHLNNRLAAKEI